MKRYLAVIGLFGLLISLAYGETLFVGDATYNGDVIAGKPHGVGTLTFTKGMYVDDEYVGEFIDGKYHGQGSYFYGREYKGNSLVGEFREDEPFRATYSIVRGEHRGDRYVGEFKDWQYDGQGTYFLGGENTGIKYSGEFKNNQPIRGTYSIDSGENKGDRYVGEFKDWHYHGEGTYNWANGDKVSGKFKNNQPFRGTQTFGREQFKGDKYVGGFKDWKYHGEGSYAFASSGNIYIGEFSYDKRIGHGTLTRSNGEKYTGEWKDDDPWDGIYYRSSGEVWGTYNRGEWCGSCKPTEKQLAATSGLASLIVASIPSNADIYINDSLKGRTQLEIKLVPGYHSVRVEKVGYEVFQQKIHLKGSLEMWASLTAKPEAKVNLGSLALIGTGTGFSVNKDYLVTAAHVVEECTSVKIRHGHETKAAKTVALDSANDLGLVRLEQRVWNVAKLRGGRPARKGERVSNYGYPLFGHLADSATITQGNINNLAGLGNDSRFIQFDAPSQPGNSGGPVLDSSGNVVGVVSHILSKKYADQTGHITQNVNFAVKSYLVEGFLSSNNVTFEKAELAKELNLPDIAEIAEQFTVLVECWD